MKHTLGIMTIALYTLTSDLHAEVIAAASQEPFIRGIEAASGIPFIHRDADYSDFGTHDVDLIYVRTGGTEGIFRQLGLDGYIRLLTSGTSNSLAASMEILSYLRQNGGDGEIIHGSAGEIAARLLAGEDAKATAGTCAAVRPLEAIDLGGKRAGVVGRPSDWLISSDVDYAKARERFGVELVDIPMSELLGEMSSFEGDTRSFEGSVAVYEALKRLVERYRLDALTVRCFDLLDTIHNTGCLALARLNAEGIPSSCEGDIPTLLSMMIAHHRTGCPGFQCNLSRIQGDELLLAHCTVPLSMVRKFHYTTHFESGIGTAIKGEIPEGPVTIFKVSPDLDSCVVLHGEILRNTSEPNLCRTQIVVRCPGAADYFLHTPLANHHIVVPGEI